MNSVFKIKNLNFKAVLKNMSKLVCCVGMAFVVNDVVEPTHYKVKKLIEDRRLVGGIYCRDCKGQMCRGQIPSHVEWGVVLSLLLDPVHGLFHSPCLSPCL